MAIEVACTGCQRKYRLDDSLAGKTAKCKVCGTKFKIEAQPAVDLASTPPPQPPTHKPRHYSVEDFQLEPLRAAPHSVKPPTLGMQAADEIQMSQAVAPPCPGCGVPRKADAVLCTNCGLDFRSGQRLETVIRQDFDSPETGRKGLRTAGWGLRLCFFGSIGAVLCGLATFVTESVFVLRAQNRDPLDDELPIDDPTILTVLAVIAGVFLLAVLIGHILCLFTPSQTGAKGLIVGAVALYVLAVVAGIVIPKIVEPSAQAGVKAAMQVLAGTLLAASLLEIGGNAVFLLFMRQLALFFDDRTLADDVGEILGWMLKIVIWSSIVIAVYIFLALAMVVSAANNIDWLAVIAGMLFGIIGCSALVGIPVVWCIIFMLYLKYLTVLYKLSQLIFTKT